MTKRCCISCGERWVEDSVSDVCHTCEAEITRPIRAPESAASNALTDVEIVAIRDDHLPSQGEAFDCIAFARAVIAALKPGNAVPREPTEAMLAAANAMPYLRAASLQMVWRTMHDAATKAGEGET